MASVADLIMFHEENLKESWPEICVHGFQTSVKQEPGVQFTPFNLSKQSTFGNKLGFCRRVNGLGSIEKATLAVPSPLKKSILQGYGPADTQGNCATEGNSGNCQSGNCHSGERWMRKPSVHSGK